MTDRLSAPLSATPRHPWRSVVAIAQEEWLPTPREGELRVASGPERAKRGP